MGQSHGAKLVGGLGQRHIQTSLAATGPLQKELQRERRLPRTRLSRYEIKPPIPVATLGDGLLPEPPACGDSLPRAMASGGCWDHCHGAINGHKVISLDP
jgi:hypothetical protein